MSITQNCIVLFFTLLLSLNSHAKSDTPIVVKVGNDSISKSELVYVYKKSKKKSEGKKQTLEQFLPSFIDLKLKIQEAKNLNLDKNADFITEYDTYFKELKAPYMLDSASIYNYTREIYDRLLENIEVSELFVAFPDGIILPKDTLATYNKIKNIEEELKSNGNNFEDLAKRYSNDTLCATASRPGYIGWITALMTDTPIENAIYNTPVNEISNPVRTNFGYVLVKPLNKRQDQGQMKVSHILLQYPTPNPSQQERDSISILANNIYNRLIAGEDFYDLCVKYSTDKQTVDRGGFIDWFGNKNPLPQAYDTALRSIKVGEITKPQEACYGYHIFRLDEIQEIASFSESKKELAKHLNESNRLDLIKFKELDNLRKEIPFELKKTSYKKLEDLAQSYMPNDSLFAEKATSFGTDILLQIDQRKYTINDFLLYMKENPYYRVRLSTDILNYAVSFFTLDLVKKAKYDTLVDLYPDLKNLAREYYEGILLFNVTNQEIWNKAQRDDTSLRNLYNENPSKYKWDSSKYEGYLVFVKNKDIEQKAKEIINTHTNSENILTTLKQELNIDGQVNVVAERGFWGKGDNEYVDSLIYGIPTQKQLIGYPIFFLEGELIKQPRNFEDVRGLVVSEYQTILEQNWVKTLREKYKVEINNDALK